MGPGGPSLCTFEHTGVDTPALRLYIRSLAYERYQDSNWTALEKRWDRRRVLGYTSLFGSAEYHGYSAQIRV